MGDTTKIEWADHTASPWYGCSHAVLSDGSEHEGCANCYAEALSKRNPATLGVWGTEGTRVLSKSFSKNCETWNKQAERDGVRRSVFPSLCDPFESVEAWDGPLNSWRAGLFSVIDNCPWLDFLLLTKRPQNVRKMWPDMHTARTMFPGMPGPLGQPMPCIVTQPYRKNVWLLASVSNQQTADEMILGLLECRDLVPVLGLSMEPLLGPVDLSPWLSDAIECERCGPSPAFTWRDIGENVVERFCVSCEAGDPDASSTISGTEPQLDWVIVGGESGHNARPMHPDWVRSIRDQCQSAGVPFFFKQWGEWSENSAGEGVFLPDGRLILPNAIDDGDNVPPLDTLQWMFKVGKKRAGRELDGRTWDEFPKAEATPCAT